MQTRPNLRKLDVRVVGADIGFDVSVVAFQRVGRWAWADGAASTPATTGSWRRPAEILNSVLLDINMLDNALVTKSAAGLQFRPNSF